MEQCCHCHKTKERTEEERRTLINRLSRIEGQVRGLKDMLQRDAYCPDILVIVNDEEGKLVKVSARDLLPFAWERVVVEE